MCLCEDYLRDHRESLEGVKDKIDDFLITD